MNSIELLGYFATVLIVLSFVTNNIIHLRILSISGASLFLIYTGINHQWPNVIVNALVLIINVYHLIKIKK